MRDIVARGGSWDDSHIRRHAVAGLSELRAPLTHSDRQIIIATCAKLHQNISINYPTWHLIKRQGLHLLLHVSKS
jgi:hypothetical protein